MGKSIYRQNAARYRSLAKTARSQQYRSILLTLASEWEAMADAAATRSKHRTDDSEPALVAANDPYGATT